MALAPLLKAVQDRALWEAAGAAGAFLLRSLRRGRVEDKEAEKASKEPAMSLTPDGWRTDKSRLNDSGPVGP